VRIDDGRPVAFALAQTLGQQSFSWVDDSYCATKFTFTRGIFDVNGMRWGSQNSFVSSYDASTGSSGAAKCQGVEGDTHTPTIQALTDALEPSPQTYYPGALLRYCITASADETSTKPKYVTAQVCSNTTVKFEARFKVAVIRQDGSPDWDGSGVNIQYFVYGPDSSNRRRRLADNASVPVYSDSTTTTQSGFIQIHLNLSVEDYPSLFNVQQLQMGFLFSKVSYFADTGVTVAHTFLCNNGRAQCNPTYPNLLTIPHLSIDEITMQIQDNTYSSFSGYVGVDQILQPQADPVAPGFRNCPLANVQLTFAEFPGGSNDAPYGMATTDSTGYYEIELPIGANAVITSIVLTDGNGTATSRPHTFILATDRAPFTEQVYSISANPRMGNNFVDVTTEIIFVDVAGGACNLSIALDASVILSRNNEFCIPPELPVPEYAIATWGWAFKLSANTDVYSLEAGTGTRFYAVVPAQQFEVVAYVNITVDNNLGSAYGVTDYFFNYRYTQEQKPVVDLTDLPQLDSGYYAGNTTSLATRVPTSPKLIPSNTSTFAPSVSPVAIQQMYYDAVNASRNATEEFEAARLVRMQYDGATTLQVTFYQAGMRVDDAYATCNSNGATLRGLNTAYLNTTVLGTSQPVTATVSAVQTYFNNATCSYLPDANITFNNQLDGGATCNTTNPCSFPLTTQWTNRTDPVTGATIPNGVNASSVLDFTALPTAVAPYARLFQFWFSGLQYPTPLASDPGTAVWYFILGQAGLAQGAATSTVSAPQHAPIAVVYDPPGANSFASVTNAQTSIQYTTTSHNFYVGPKVDIATSGTDGSVLGQVKLQDGVDAFGVLAAATTVTGSAKLDFKAGFHSVTEAKYGHSWDSGYTNTRTLTWSVTTSSSSSTDMADGAVGAMSDMFVMAVEVIHFAETDIIVSGSSCSANLHQVYSVVTASPSDMQLAFYSRYQIINSVVPTLQQLANDPATTAAELTEINSALSTFTTMLKPPTEATTTSIETDFGNSYIYDGLTTYFSATEDKTRHNENAANGVSAMFDTDPSNDFPNDYMGFPKNEKLSLSISGGGAPVTYTLQNNELISSSYGNSFDFSQSLTGIKSSVKEVTTTNALESVTSDRSAEFGGLTGGQLVTTNGKSYAFGATSSFTLSDASFGDLINVDVEIDSVYGTFFFTVTDGATMCPHEDNTQYRELPALAIVSAQDVNVSPGQPASYVLQISNLGNSDIAGTPDVTYSNFLLRSFQQQNEDGVRVVVDGLPLTWQGVKYYNINQSTSFLVDVEVYAGAKQTSYSLDLRLTTECGFDYPQVLLTPSFLPPCPGIALVGDFLTNNPLAILAGSSSVIDLAFQNLAPNYATWSSIGNVAAVEVEWAFAGTGQWNVLVDSFGQPVQLGAIESPVTRFAVYPWDVRALGLNFASIQVRGVVRCTVPPNANPDDVTLTSTFSALTGTINIDLVAPFVMGFEPRSQVSPGDVFRVSFSEPVNCPGPSFLVYLLLPPGPSVPAVGGISTVAENLIVECSGNVVAVSIKPGTVSLLSLAGTTWFLLFTGVQDAVGNAVTTNILASSPWYLYQKPGNVQVALRFAEVDSASSSFTVTGLELSGVTDLANHGTYVIGTPQYAQVVQAIELQVGNAVNIDPSRVEVVYFWFASVSQPTCVVNLVIVPASPPIAGENVVALFKAAYPSLFSSNGAQSMDLLPVSKMDVLEAQGRATASKLDALQAQLAEVLALLGATHSPTTTGAPAPSFKPTPFPTYSPVRTPSHSPTKRPTSKRPSPRPTLRPTQWPTSSPTPPTRLPSQAPSHARPSQAPSKRPSASPTFLGQTYAPSTAPTAFPSAAPAFDQPSHAPTHSPSRLPSQAPLPSPSSAPTLATPSSSPFASYPTKAPVNRPTSAKPTTTTVPTQEPTSAQPTTLSPTRKPTIRPIKKPKSG